MFGIKTDYLERTTNQLHRNQEPGVKSCAQRIHECQDNIFLAGFVKRDIFVCFSPFFFIWSLSLPLSPLVFFFLFKFFLFHFMCRSSMITTTFSLSVCLAHLICVCALLFFLSFRCCAVLLVLTIFLWLISILNKSSFYFRSFEHLCCVPSSGTEKKERTFIPSICISFFCIWFFSLSRSSRSFFSTCVHFYQCKLMFSILVNVVFVCDFGFAGEIGMLGSSICARALLTIEQNWKK